MRILAVGDPHGDLERMRKIPKLDIDLILLTGDLGSASLMRNMAFENIERQKKGLAERIYSSRERKLAFMEAYTSSMRVVKYLSQFAPVFTIYGNVESSNAETRKNSREIGLPLPFLTDDLKKLKNVKIINNKLVNFNGLRIAGLQYFIDTSWVKEFRPSEYRKAMSDAKKDSDRAKNILRKFGELDILVCHQPPYGFLDKVTSKFAPKHWFGKHAGSKTIRQYIERMHPDYVFCGHIHEGEGMKRIGGTEVYNLGVCGYKIINL